MLFASKWTDRDENIMLTLYYFYLNSSIKDISIYLSPFPSFLINSSRTKKCVITGHGFYSWVYNNMHGRTKCEANRFLPAIPCLALPVSAC